MTKVKLNALDKDGSGAFSEIVRGNNLEQLKAAEKDFETRIPFSRYYFDHEFEEGDVKLYNLFVGE